MFTKAASEAGRELPAAARGIELRDGDRVFVRRLQGLRDEGDVILSGEVLYPGPYALERRDETVSSLIRRAGGLTSEAYVGSHHRGSGVSRTRWREGMTLGDYLDQAGGVVEEGDRNRAVVTYANQERKRSSKFLFFRSDPKIEPGSTISVPFKEQREGGGFNGDQLLTRLLCVATILVAIWAL